MKTISQDKIRAASDALKGIAHEIRLSVLCHLVDRPMSVNELVEVTGASQSNLSQHLSKMRLLGLLEAEKNGKQIIYRISHPGFTQVIAALQSIYCPDDEGDE